MEDRRQQIQIIRRMWQGSPAQMGSVLYGLQTVMGSGIALLQEKGCLLWGDLEVWSFSLVSVMKQWSELMVCSVNPQGSPLSYPKRQRTSLYSPRDVSWTISLRGISHVPLHGLLFWLQLMAVTPHLATGNNVIQETVSFSLILIQ